MKIRNGKLTKKEHKISCTIKISHDLLQRVDKVRHQLWLTRSDYFTIAIKTASLSYKNRSNNFENKAKSLNEIIVSFNIDYELYLQTAEIAEWLGITRSKFYRIAILNQVTKDESEIKACQQS